MLDEIWYDFAEYTAGGRYYYLHYDKEQVMSTLDEQQRRMLAGAGTRVEPMRAVHRVALTPRDGVLVTISLEFHRPQDRGRQGLYHRRAARPRGWAPHEAAAGGPRGGLAQGGARVGRRGQGAGAAGWVVG